MSSGAVANNSVVQEALARAQQLAAANSSDRSSIGQKRPHSDDSSFVPVAKRANDGQASSTMNNMSEYHICETVEIPDNVVGLVIGRGGEQITAIQQQTGCRVQMANDPTESGTRLCTLNGPKANVDAAKKMITDVIGRSAGRQTTNPGMMPPGGGASSGYITETMMIPGQKCGLVIGRNGETIKTLQEQLGVKMLLIQENQSVSSGPKPLRISGDPMKVENAKRTVEGLINNEEGARVQVSKSVGEVIVPRASVGIIIGKGGETIKRLGLESGCKIQFKPDDDPSTPDRCATLQGSAEQITRATQMISDLLQRSQSQGQQETFLMHVPANKTGLVIGKGGDTIKQINAESGAHVELSRDPPPNPAEKVFVIKGTGYQIHHAQHIIKIKVGDIPPGTPVPHFPGVTTNLSAFGGAGTGYDSYSQWNQGGGYGQAAAQNWSSYYGGTPGQGDASQHTAYTSYGQTAATQSQSQQGGQPDYSQQWIEYYRQMGMHDKAALVEQQAKAAQSQSGSAIGGTSNTSVYSSGSYN
uniref:K Homology domain-containing protein n=2 Tax=Panagrolaimus sp. JU765 TaxID=591449 RepID=A0AC34QWA0_9BILA